MNAEKMKATLKVPPLSTANTVALIGIVSVVLLIALRMGFRPVNLS